MNLVRSVGLARLQSPRYVSLARYERLKLRAFPCWVRCLYEELVGLSNLTTGQVWRGSSPNVSYAKLASLLDHDKSPQGGGRNDAGPSVQQIRRALDDLVRAGLVVRDARTNENAKGLFLLVLSRPRAIALSRNADRGADRPQEGRKLRRFKNLEPKAGGVPTEVPTGDSEGLKNNPLPPESAELSTGPRPPEPSTPPGPIRVWKGYDQAPQGAEQSPPQGGHAPQRDTVTQRAMRQRMNKAPPGGPTDTPPADGAQVQAELAAVRARMQAFERGGVPKARQETDTDAPEEAQGGP